jgi:hypothetical protein
MVQMDELINKATKPISSLQEFFILGRNCISALLKNADKIPVVSAGYENYVLPFLPDQNFYLRPINQDLFIYDIEQIVLCQREFQNLITQLGKTRGNLSSLSQNLKEFITKGLIIKTIYTVLQGVGCILDNSANTQAARKNFGQRFEDFIKIILKELNIANDSFMFKKQISIINVPYRVPLDLIINTGGRIYSEPSSIDQRDTILSIKTSSKDRMKFIFVDRFVLRNVLKLERINIIALCHNDVQRSGKDGINSTFLPDIYMVFCHVFGELPLYYLDPPIIAASPRFHGNIKTFDEFLLYDLWKL